MIFVAFIRINNECQGLYIICLPPKLKKNPLLLKYAVMDEYASSNREELDERKVLLNMIEEQEAMLSNARRRLVKEEIDSEDFKILKKECSDELKKLERFLSEVPARSQSLKTIEGLLDIVVEKGSSHKVVE